MTESLRSSRLPEVVEAYEIRGEAGRVVARCDLAIPIVRLGIEAHSRRFHDHTSAEAYIEPLVARRANDLGIVLPVRPVRTGKRQA